MAIDANYKAVDFGIDENGDKQELTIDNATGDLVIEILGTATTPSKPTAKIDANYEGVAFGTDGSENIVPLVTDTNGRLFIDTASITITPS